MKKNFAAKNGVCQPKIKIIGIGGCGLAVTNCLEEHLKNTEIFLLDSDKENLEKSKLDEKHKIQIGEKLTDSLGCGGNPNVGKQAALESRSIIEKLVLDTDLVITAAGVAGGTGSGVTPVVTKIAKDLGATNIVFAVTPAKFEGDRKNEVSDAVLQKFSDKLTGVDAVVNVSIERFINKFDKKATFQELCDFVSRETAKAIKSIIDIFQEGLIQINFDDFKRFITNAGYIGICVSEKTENIKSGIKAIADYPMIQGSFESADKIIISVKAGNDVILSLIYEINQSMQEEFDLKDDTEMLFGVQTVKEFESDEVQVTVITA